MPLDHSHIELLLGSLAGILSARVLVGDQGELEAIHIVAEPEFLPKRIVRNVESALCAGLGIEIDRRIVSVANVREGAPWPVASRAASAEPPAEPGTGPLAKRPAEPEAEPPAPATGRIIFESIELSIDTARDALCRVTLRLGTEDATRESTGPDSPRGRAEAASRAAIAAIRALAPDRKLDLEEIALAEIAGRPIVLVSVRALEGRRSHSLTGIAAVDRSAEEAAALATLNATHRWMAART